jgi:hypothetical protein
MGHHVQPADPAGSDTIGETEPEPDRLNRHTFGLASPVLPDPWRNLVRRTPMSSPLEDQEKTWAKSTWELVEDRSALGKDPCRCFHTNRLPSRSTLP